MDKQKVIKKSFIIIILIILGKIMAFIRDALIASKFGATYNTDIYMFSLGVVMLLTTIGYGLTTTLIPIHIENIENKSKDYKNAFISNLLNVSSLFTILSIVLAILLSPYIIYIFAPGFRENPEVFAKAVYILRIMFVSLIFVSMQSIVTGVLQAHKEFYEPVAMAFASNIVFVAYLVFLSDKYGMTGFAIATVLGFASQLVINIPKFKKLGYKYVFILNFNDKSLKKLVKMMFPVIISTSIIQINLFVSRHFATTVYEGAVSTLEFSNKLNMLIYEVFAVAISMLIYPTLATYAAKENKEEYKTSLLKAINVILLIMVPASIAVLILREPIVSVIFKRGAFDEDAVKVTAKALMFYTPAMVAYGVRDILYKAFYSLKDTKTPMISSIAAVIINIILSLILVKNMEVSGLAFASALSCVITTLILIIFLDKKLNGINIIYLFKVFFKIFISSVIMGFIIFNIKNFSFLIFGANFKGEFVSIILSFIVGVIVYFLCIYLFKVEEYMYFCGLIRRKFLKNKR